MVGSFRDAVQPDYPSRIQPQSFPTTVPRTGRDALEVLDSLRPSSGNLAQSEAWRRMLGGRKRYNHQRQQVARARREAILCWLMDNRIWHFCRLFGEHFRVNRIIVRHGDGAMLARALNVGKATICRDLSALQAESPSLFGRQNCGISYDEYMAGWRYAHRTRIGNEQPHHNLRFPSNQRGPEARTKRAAMKASGRVVYADRADAGIRRSGSEARNATAPANGPTPTVEDFLTMLNQKCPTGAPPELPPRRRRRVLKEEAA